MKHLKKKRVENLTVADFGECAVWKFASPSGTTVTPDRRLPCTSLANRLVGTLVTLADGTTVMAYLGNIDVSNEISTKHFMTVAVLVNGEWVPLARYHDLDSQEAGPKNLADKLGKPLTKVFPIKFDVQNVVRHAPSWLKGIIEADPKIKLSADELVDLALQD
jgi:hypothetical protein